MQDLRYALRVLRKNPGFAVTGIVTLALGIGANTALFTLTNAMLLNSLAVPRPDRLIEITCLDRGGDQQPFSVPSFQGLQSHNEIFSGMFGWTGGGVVSLEVNGVSFGGTLDAVTGGYYSTLGVHPLLGRLITPEDVGLEKFTRSPVAVLGHRFWEEHYARDPNVLGKKVVIEAKPYTIIGVHPKSFPGMVVETATDVTVPVTARAQSAERFYDRRRTFLTVVGRLRDDVSPQQAQARLTAIWPPVQQTAIPLDASAAQRESFLGRRLQVEPAGRGLSFIRGRFTRPLQILFGIVGLLLLLACVNLANVSLARAQRRASELSLRVALGASRWRLLRAALIESLLLSLAGMLPGLAIAYWGSKFIAKFIWPGYVPLALSLTPDTRILLFTTAVALAAGVLCGVAPAWRAARQDPGTLVRRDTTRTTTGIGILGRALVTIQVALSFAIVSGALLFSRSLANITRPASGFQADRLLVAQLFPRAASYEDFEKAPYFRELLRSLQSIPGASAAALSATRPIGPVAWKETVSPAGSRDSKNRTPANQHVVTPGFFEALGMSLLRGRDFDLRDDTTRPAVAIVSAKLARSLFASADAVGRHLKIGERQAEFEIVGITSDANLDDPRKPGAPGVYLAYFQQPDYMGWSEAILRSNGDPSALTTPLRQRMEALGREYPLRIETIAAERDMALVPERIVTVLSSFFGVLATLLAAVGLYGLLSYTVSRRTPEIGIRVALGSPHGSVVWLVVRDVLILLAVGLAAGLAITLAASRLISSLLYGLTGHDPVALILAAVALLGIAALATFIPVRRAVRIDPAVALRHE